MDLTGLPAMLLAAGGGSRMRPLTDRLPKPLLRVGQQSLVEYHLTALARAGVERVVINTGRNGSMFHALLGDGSRYGVSIRYSDEGKRPLETAGGIVKALPQLGDRFLVVSSDVYTDFAFEHLEPGQGLGHLLLVDNPPEHRDGDFALVNGRARRDSEPRLTFAGIAILNASLFEGRDATPAPLRDVLHQAADDGQLSAQRLTGFWCDVGTPQRLRELRARLSVGHQ